MLIKALCDYYDAHLQNSQSASSDYFSEQNVHYMIFLTPEGDISDIIDVQVSSTITLKNGKEKQVLQPLKIEMPKRSQKTGIDLNIIEHRPLYIFGLNYDKESGTFTPEDKTKKAEKSHECFAKGNLEFCADIHSTVVDAYSRFIEKWVPAEQTENPCLLKLGKNYASAYFCFALDGHPEITLHEDTELRKKYVTVCEETATAAEVEAVCPIEGERLPVARIHDKIRGVKGGNAVGGVLVGINDTAFESYGKTQSYNTNISEKAMKKYTVSLNSLLADRKHRCDAEEMTIVYFAISEDDSKECDLMSFLMNGDSEEKANAMLDTCLKKALQGEDASFQEADIDEDVTFYVAGLTPNSSRISQKFIVKDRFGRMIDNIVQHQKDLQVTKEGKQVPLWRITKELVSPNSNKETVPSPLISGIFNAVMMGTKYPDMLLDTVVRRVKTDSDQETNAFIKLNNTRVGIIKACINRKARIMHNKEEITMGLDQNNTNPAYLCGRLFAVLEYIQQLSAGSKLNRTIKDAYFASACSKPAVVFPKLMMLSENHMAKLESSAYWKKSIGDILSAIEDTFPQTLSIEDQGRFILGYYHQNKDLYTSKTKNDESTETNNEKEN